MEKGISIQTLHRKILFLPEAIEIRTEMSLKDSSVLQWLMAKLDQILDSRRRLCTCEKCCLRGLDVQV